MSLPKVSGGIMEVAIQALPFILAFMVQPFSCHGAGLHFCYCRFNSLCFVYCITLIAIATGGQHGRHHKN